MDVQTTVIISQEFKSSFLVQNQNVIHANVFTVFSLPISNTVNTLTLIIIGITITYNELSKSYVVDASTSVVHLDQKLCKDESKDWSAGIDSFSS